MNRLQLIQLRMLPKSTQRRLVPKGMHRALGLKRLCTDCNGFGRTGRAPNQQRCRSCDGTGEVDT